MLPLPIIILGVNYSPLLPPFASLSFTLVSHVLQACGTAEMQMKSISDKIATVQFQELGKFSVTQDWRFWFGSLFSFDLRNPNTVVDHTKWPKLNYLIFPDRKQSNPTNEMNKKPTNFWKTWFFLFSLQKLNFLKENEKKIYRYKTTHKHLINKV